MSTETTTPVKCSDCGAEIAEKDDRIVTHSGDTICETCMDNYSMCEDSEEYFHLDDLTIVYEKNSRGHKVEKLVYSLDNYTLCAHSEEYWAESEMTTVYNSRGCTKEIAQYYIDRGEVDTFICDDCGDVFLCDDNENTIDDGDRYVCNGCVESGDYHYCEDAGGYVTADNCQCHSEDDDSLIKDHDYKPAPLFKGESSKTCPFFGFELEAEATGETRTALAERIMGHDWVKNDLYLKSDGSLTHGLEIVSHPMTLVEHQARAAKYAALFNDIAQNGGRSHDTTTCGLHVHIEKRFMTMGHKVRMGIFFVLLKPMLEKLARRSESHWCKFKKKDLKNRSELTSSEEKYAAINWKPRNTVEIRIFKGTLKPETFMASLELVQAIYSFTLDKHCFSTKLESKNLEQRFIKYVMKRPGLDALKAYMATKLHF